MKQTNAPGEKELDEEQRIRFRLEDEFAGKHKRDSDASLLRYLRDCAAQLDHLPTKQDIIGCRYLKQRFGPWHRVLEKAGLKTLGNRPQARALKYAAEAETQETALKN